jgi:hypothetical protein
MYQLLIMKMTQVAGRDYRGEGGEEDTSSRAIVEERRGKRTQVAERYYRRMKMIQLAGRYYTVDKSKEDTGSGTALEEREEDTDGGFRGQWRGHKQMAAIGEGEEDTGSRAVLEDRGAVLQD